MNSGRIAFAGARIFDGRRILTGRALYVIGGVVEAIVPEAELPADVEVERLPGGILAPGFVDLQVNGGGGVMFNDAPEVGTLRRMAEAHAGLGTVALFPTLITDTSEHRSAAVDAVAEAVAQEVPGIAGLHLEGPHLSVSRKGAHDASLIRPMSDDDLEFLVGAASRLPRLLVTVAPESVTGGQMAALASAGVLVSLGHSDAGFDAARTAAAHGARMVTHLFNAMSGLGHREPGLVGAALASPALDAGLIADGFHVHPAAMAAALRAKAGPGEIFLVTDAMATAGSELSEFTLNGRVIRREAGRLTLSDGTLAGAHVDMARSLRVLTREAGVAVTRALAMATRIPARVGGLSDRFGAIEPGRPADIVHLDGELNLAAVWRRGVSVSLSPVPISQGAAS